MKPTRIPHLLAAAAVLASIPSVTALTWIFDASRATCSGDPFTNVILQAACVDQSSCSGYISQNGSTCVPTAKICRAGNRAEISGRLTATTAFPDNQVVVKPCLAGICPKSDRKVDGRLCNWLKPVSDQQCGEEGEYQFQYIQQLPSGNGLPSWLFDRLTIKVTVDGDSESECSDDMSQTYGYGASYSGAMDEPSAEWPYPLMGLVAMAGITMALFRERRKRKRLERELEDEDTMGDDTMGDDETAYELDEDSFVEMIGGVSSGNSPSEAGSSIPAVIEPSRMPSPAQRWIKSARQSMETPSPAFSKDSSIRTHSLPVQELAASAMRQSPVQESYIPPSPVVVVQSSSPERMPRPGNLPQQHSGQGRSPGRPGSLPQHVQEIRLETLKEWYEQHGIAIV